RRDTSTAAPASAQATCTARSAARAPGGRPPRGSGAAGLCRTGSSGVLRSFDALRQFHPFAPVAVGDLDLVAHRREDAGEIQLVAALELVAHRAKWADRGLELLLEDTDAHGDVPVGRGP